MEAPSNRLNILFVNPHFSDPHITELDSFISKVTGLDPDIVYLSSNQICGSWILEKLKTAHIELDDSTSRRDSLKCLLINKTRIQVEHTSCYEGSSFDAYKIVIKNRVTDRVSVVGVAVINESAMSITEENEGDMILKKHDLIDWFDLNKELEHVTKAKVASVPSMNTNSVLYNNLKKLLPIHDNHKEESKHHGISALVHKIIDKKKDVLDESKPESVVEMDVNTIFCKIRMESHAASDHIIDEGEVIHQFMFVDKVSGGNIPSLRHTTP